MVFIEENFSLPFSTDCVFSDVDLGDSGTRIYRWFSLLILFYLVAYSSLKECVKILIINKPIPKLNQMRFINTLWRLKFCCLYFVIYRQYLFKPLNAVTLNSSSSVISDFFSVALESGCKNNVEKKDLESLCVLIYYAMPVTFFIHQIYVSLSSCISSSVLPLVSFSIFLHATYSMRNLDLSAKFLFLTAINEGSMELTRACLALKSKCKGFKGPSAPVSVRIITMSLFVLHICTRLIVVSYLYPTLFFSLPSLTEAERSIQLPTAYVNIFLTLYFPWQVFYSPIWSLLEIIVRPKGQKPFKLWSVPDLVLLPYSSSLLYELREIQMDSLKNLPLSSAEIRTMRRNLLAQNKESSPEAQPSQGLDHAGGLLSVVKCMIALKKKMRNRYKRRFIPETQPTEFDESCLLDKSEDVDNCHPSTSSHVGFPPTDDEDVTDIFIPVPNLSHTSLPECSNEAKGKSEESLILKSTDCEELIEATVSVNLDCDQTCSDTVDGDQTHLGSNNREESRVQFVDHKCESSEDDHEVI